MPAAVYVVDVAGLIVRYNGKAAELWGRTPKLGDAEDRYCGSWRLHRTDGRPLPHADWPVADVLRTGQPARDQEVVIERPDGSRVAVLANIVALRDATGAVTGAINCLHDITQRKRSEAALRESEGGLSRELAAAERLQEISTLLIQEGNVDALYHRILDAAIAVMRSDMASMQMLDHGRGELRLLASTGFHPESAAFWEWVRLDSGCTCGTALSSGQRVVVPDIETCDLIVGTPDFDAYRKSGIRAVQSTPLISRTGRLLGMISTHWREPHQPADRDLRLLDVLARQAADLFERTQAEAALRESEARHRRIFRTAAVSIWDEDFSAVKTALDALRAQGVSDLRRYLDLHPDFVAHAVRLVRINDVNDATVRLFEAAEKAELLTSLDRIFLPQTLNVFRDELVAIFEGRPSLESEAPLRTLKGRPLDVVFSMSFAPDDPRLERVLVSLMDITDRKTTEKAAAHLAAIVDSSEDAIVGKTLDGIVTSWNRGAELLFGYSADEIVGRSITMLFPADRIGEEAVILDRIRRGERVAHYETVRRRKDGREIDVSLTVSPVRDAVGRIVGASKIAQDVSARKRVEDALRHSEERHRGLAEAIAAVVWTTDAQGQVADIPQWRALTGQSVEQVRGSGWLDAIHPDDRALTREVWARAVKMQVPCDTEYRVRMAGGEYCWFNARGVPILDDDGSVLEWVGVCIDITLRKRAEDKTKLLAREVNHRANNLLTIINAMMRQTRAQTAAELITAMQGRIGALSRVQTRLARDQWDRTDLLRLVGEELAPFGKDIAGRFEISGPPVPLSADAAQALAIVVHELATNAVKYGALSVSRGRVSIAWSFSEERLVLSWRETGGPAVSSPAREGFGTRAIALLTQQLEGDVQLEWTPAGLACELGIPAKNLGDRN